MIAMFGQHLGVQTYREPRSCMNKMGCESGDQLFSACSGLYFHAVLRLQNAQQYISFPTCWEQMYRNLVLLTRLDIETWANSRDTRAWILTPIHVYIQAQACPKDADCTYREATVEDNKQNQEHKKDTVLSF